VKRCSRPRGSRVAGDLWSGCTFQDGACVCAQKAAPFSGKTRLSRRKSLQNAPTGGLSRCLFLPQNERFQSLTTDFPSDPWRDGDTRHEQRARQRPSDCIARALRREARFCADLVTIPIFSEKVKTFL
jgi:hypothetical protein